MNKVQRLLKNMDWLFLVLIMLILGFSLIVLKSASGNVVNGQPYYYVLRQLLWMIIGFALMVGIALIDYNVYNKCYKYMYVFINILLFLVLFTEEKKGAHRWFDLGFMDFQPSELAKLVMIVALACFLANRDKEMHLLQNMLLYVAYMALPFVLIIMEPDLGTALVFIVVSLAMAFIGGVPPKVIFTIVMVILLVVALLFGFLYFPTHGYQTVPDKSDIPDWLPLKPYQIMRLVIFINPYMDPLGKGYHMIQSEVAIGSGGFLGKGYEQGSQVQGDFLPEHHTDFIFSVIGEELGFVGAIMLLILYGSLLMRGLVLAHRAKDSLGKNLIVGIMTMIFFQIFVNVGMTIGVMPITGLPLPFLSYGGSGMLVNMMSMGIVLSVVLHRRVVIF